MSVGSSASSAFATARRQSSWPTRRVSFGQARQPHPAAAGHLPLQLLLLGSLFPVTALLLDSVWAFAAGTARDWFAGSPRRTRAIGGIGGLVMIGVGVDLALTGRQS